MKKDDVFPSKYLKAADLLGKRVTVTIASAPFETLKSPDGKEQGKTVLHFAGGKKCFPLNLTNWQSCAEICGDDTDDWPGNKIVLVPTKTEMAGKQVACIRIEPPAQRELLKKAPPPPPDDDPDELGTGPNNEVPF